ncbi:MAG: hypothetical protein ABII06_19690 [Pseudomonadota bacterium]
MLPRGRGDDADSDRGSYGLPDLSRHRVVKIVETGNRQIIEMVKEILDSRETGTIEALKSNVRQFYEQVKDKARIEGQNKRIGDMEREIEELRDEVRLFKNGKARSDRDGGESEHM